MTTKQHLTHLESTGLLRLAQTQPELEYLFRHALVQDAAYESLLLADRKELHRQIGETLERLYPDRLDELASLLGQHFAKAGESEKAIAYLLRAGDRMRGLYAHQEAINFYQQALTLLREEADDQRTATTFMKLGLTYHNALNFKESRQAYEAGFELWQKAKRFEPPHVLPAPHALRLAWREPESLDPTRITTVTGDSIIKQLFSGLLCDTPDMELVPEVAHSWEILDEGRKYIFHLRKDMVWSDGVAVTARDFEYAWKGKLDPVTGSRQADLLYDIKGAQAFHQAKVSDPNTVGVYTLDKFTLIVELERPTGYFLHLLANIIAYPIPQHVVAVEDKNWTAVNKIVTNGPFLLETWNKNELMVLSRNPVYKGRFSGNLERVELYLHWEDGGYSTAGLLEAYDANHLDLIGILSPVRIDMKQVWQQRIEEYLSAPALRNAYVGFNVNRPPFDDPQVRRAFAMALDLDQLPASGFFPATGGIIPAGMPGHSVGIKLPFQPHEAQHLLAKAGYPTGRQFPVTEFLTHHGWEERAQYLQNQWSRNLGIDIKWKAITLGEFDRSLYEEPPALFFAGLIADYPDPGNFLNASDTQQVTGWQNQAFNRLVEQAREVTDHGTRMTLYQQADKMLIEEAVLVPVGYGRSEWLMKPWVKNYPVSAINYWFWKDVIIESH